MIIGFHAPFRLARGAIGLKSLVPAPQILEFLAQGEAERHLFRKGPVGIQRRLQAADMMMIRACRAQVGQQRQRARISFNPVQGIFSTSPCLFKAPLRQPCHAQIDMIIRIAGLKLAQFFIQGGRVIHLVQQAVIHGQLIQCPDIFTRLSHQGPNLFQALRALSQAQQEFTTLYS